MQETQTHQRYLVFYGKGGIGKTTVGANLAAALAGMGEGVLLIGCSPKASLFSSWHLKDRTPILDLDRQVGISEENFCNAVWTTPEGVILTETGGPEPGVGCAGRGIPAALQSLGRYGRGIEGMGRVTFSLYDLIGDVVCGGFAAPMRAGGEREVFIVTSGELMALYAANNIARAVASMPVTRTVDVKIGGLIANMRGVLREREILERFSEMTGIPILAFIPRDPETFRAAESQGRPVVSVFPDSPIAGLFRELARKVRSEPLRLSPSPIENYDELFNMFMQFQKEAAETFHPGSEGAEDGCAGSLQEAKALSRTGVKRVSIYGTGGIGKSTISANLSAALVLFGERVYQVGCDPKRDSIANLCGELKPTVLDSFYAAGGRNWTKEQMHSMVFEGQGYNGKLYGTECGGPAPGRGCAGKGVEVALRFIEKYRIVEEKGVTFVLYDVLGDTVCGGFATPFQFAPLVYVVTSGELATMVQAMKILQSVENLRCRGVNVGVAGIINNRRGVAREDELVEEVFDQVGVPVIHHVPRSNLVQEAENLKQTVMRAFPDSDQAREFMALAEKVQRAETTFPLKREILSSLEIQEIINRYE